MVDQSYNDDEGDTKNIMMGFESERVHPSAGVFLVLSHVESPQNHSGDRTACNSHTIIAPKIPPGTEDFVWYATT